MAEELRPLPVPPGRILLSPAFRLLVACSWLPQPQLAQREQDAIVSLCRDGIDWDDFLFLVQRHRLHSIAHAVLHRAPAGCVPERVRETLNGWNLRQCARSLRHGAELLRLNALFAEEGIRFIPLKGMLLSQQLYGSPRMRHSSDIDLMVRPDDLQRADALLRRNGFTEPQLGTRLSLRQREYLKENLHHLDYHQPGAGIHLELHCRSFLASPEQTASLWRDQETVHWEGRAFTVLNAENRFLYLCEHGARHKWFRLKWLSDLAMLIAGDEAPEWERLMALARRLDLYRTVAHSALLTAGLYRLELPPPLHDAVSQEQRHAVSLSAEALCALQHRSGVEAEIIGTPFTAFRRLRHIARLRPALRYRQAWRELLVNHFDFARFPLPDQLFWLYVPLRPLFWALRKLDKSPQPGES